MFASWEVPFNLGGECKCAGEEDNGREKGEDPGESAPVLAVFVMVGDLWDVVFEEEESSELEGKGNEEGGGEG
jgi:hypothetical protein